MCEFPQLPDNLRRNILHALAIIGMHALQISVSRRWKNAGFQPTETVHLVGPEDVTGRGVNFPIPELRNVQRFMAWESSTS